jgi:two-component system sensor histidine kinase BarA
VRSFVIALLPIVVANTGFALYLWLDTGEPGLALAGFALTVLLAVDHLRNMLRPIRLVNRAMHQVRAGELGTRVDTRSKGEMGELEVGFNDMAEELQAAQGQLQERIDQATREVQESMEVIEIRNAELDLARRRAIEASRAKSEFLANMSHEIRTPLNGIVGFTALLDKTGLDSRQQEFLDVVQKSVRSLLRIVGDILDFSRLESGKLVLVHEPFSLRECVETATTLWAPQAHAKQLELVSIVYSDVPDALVGDEARIIQILNNLLGNAVRFTDRGEIIVRVMLEDEQPHKVTISFAVSDTGIGIPLADQQRLFLAFDQGSSTTTRLLGGTGLGLSICHALATAMQGKVEVSSRVDEGSVFHVTLTLETDPDAPSRRHSPPLHRRGLLVEPHALSRVALLHAMQDMGLAVDESERLDPADAIDSDRYALVALGCAGDAVSARRCLDQVERIRQQAGIPVMVLVSSSDQALLTRFTDRGASACLSKPVPRKHVQDAIRRCLRGVLARQGGDAASPPATAETPARDAARVLDGKACVAADDHPVNLALVTHLLRDLGAEVLEASDGASAVALAEAQPIDMAFLDIHMPRMNGLEAARRIQAHYADRPIPIVALTADAAGRNQRDIMRAGIHRTLIKPVTEADLRKTAGDLLNGIVPAALIDATPPVARTTDLPVRDAAQALRIAGGSERIANRLFNEMRRDLPHAIDDLQTSFATRNWSEMWQLSHRLHGAAAVCGVPALHYALGELQPAVALEDEVAVSLLLAQTVAEIDRILALDV